ncbi:hypothetical protein [Christiangramia sp.]|uniref:hypothetical protein n=1 Tax=Christiangramia sp. TaxID=1931228 RepID=UPI00260FE16E|nr:hypothetical protein [Christiangramia sp.]
MLLEKYRSALNSTNDLSKFIEENGDKLFDYYGLINHKELEKRRKEFEKIILRYPIISNLDFSNQVNEAYLNLLLLTAIRLGDRFVFERFYNLLSSNNLEKSLIIQASSKYMYRVRSRQELEEALPTVLDLLDKAYIEESHSDDDVIACLVNYYALFIKDFFEFSPHRVHAIKDSILASIDNKEYSFLANGILKIVFNITLENETDLFYTIQEHLDEFLGRDRVFSFYDSGLLLEKDTSYSEEILKMEFSLENLLKMNRILYSEIRDDKYYEALGRGVNILDKEEYMLAYMYAYGKMHIAKLRFAISKLPDYIDNSSIIDWGCGQGLASMVLVDEIGTEKINSICLIEPSNVCLKRAALHLVQKLSSIKTINKDFDSLNGEDLEAVSQGESYIHLFSNILDVEMYSISNLIQLIKSRFKGTNYFVISSPYITSLKTARIDSFINSFAEDFEAKVFFRTEKRKGEWKNNWSKVIRVIMVEIE